MRRRPEKRDYLPVETYHELADALLTFIPLVFRSLERFRGGTNRVIIRNFMARACVSLNGVMVLWDVRDHHDCWVLYRCLLDRLFHLNYLIETDTFDQFEAWSFVEQYDLRHRSRSDADFRERLDREFFSDTDEEKRRIEEFRRHPPQWRRPKAWDVAKSMDLRFLYKQGYDCASTMVHPMANDGDADFYLITKGALPDAFPDQRAVLGNSCLVAYLIVREGLGGGGLLWRSVVHDFIDQGILRLQGESTDYLLALAKLRSLPPETDLCTERGRQGA
jgi:hypothetical protein